MARVGALDDPFFLPANSAEEAIARIFSLTGRAPDSAAVRSGHYSLYRDALGLDIELSAQTPLLGGPWTRLDVVWDERVHVDRNIVTFAGLNVLLEGATEAKRLGSLQRLRDEAPLFTTDRRWAAFEPARSKIEAVTRIAALTDAPKEWLGPGGKEHKSVLLNLADRPVPRRRRHRPIEQDEAGASSPRPSGCHGRRCGSTGETISLARAQHCARWSRAHLGRLGSRVTDALADTGG